MLVEKKVLYVSEVASCLGCSSHVIYKMIHSGKLAAYKDDGAHAWKIPEEAIATYIESRKRHFKQGK